MFHAEKHTLDIFKCKHSRARHKKIPAGMDLLTNQFAEFSLKEKKVANSCKHVTTLAWTAQAEHSYSSADFRLKILQGITFGISVFECIWCLDGVLVIVEPAFRHLKCL